MKVSHLLLFLLCGSVLCSITDVDLIERLLRTESTIAMLVDEINVLKATQNNSLGYINAANSPYNAIGDSTTDNTNAIQSALNAASASVR